MTAVAGPLTDTDTAAALPLGGVPPFLVEETDRLLTTTRSVRRRLDPDRPVPRSIVEEALQVAVHAPSADDQQNWRFVVVTDPGVRAAVGEVFRRSWEFHRADVSGRAGRRRHSPAARRNEASVAALAATIAQVPVLVVPCVIGPAPDPAAIDAQWAELNAHKPADDPAHEVRMGHLRASTWFGSIYPAVWSLQLALRSRGLGSTVTCMHLPFAAAVAELLGIPSAVTQVCLLPVAWTVGTDFGPAARVPARDRTYWERWGAPAEAS